MPTQFAGRIGRWCGHLSVPASPTYFDNSRTRSYCAYSRCGWGRSNIFLSLIIFLHFLPLSWKGGWMNDEYLCLFYNSISVISGQWAGDNQRMCAMEPRLQMKKSSPQAGLEPGAARSVGSV